MVRQRPFRVKVGIRFTSQGKRNLAALRAAEEWAMMNDYARQQFGADNASIDGSD